ncbi:MAG: hypothetical protein IJ722_06515 [Alloprevotella sp.]|nr:hypothetical protein [Alloprevotella sp.]
MTTSKIFSCTFALLLLGSLSVRAQQPQQSDTVRTARVRGIQFSQTPAENREAPLWAGLSFGFDLCGAVMAVATPWGQYEGTARLNLRGRYFPCVELGVGVSDCTGESSHVHYRTHSPYIRLGCDYNFVGDSRSGNRIFGGLRYGLSPYRFDVGGPDLTDEVYGSTLPFAYKGMKSTAHWAELVGGVEAQVAWKFFHLGWTVRYKFRISESRSEVGRGWYVPGFGKSGTHALGGSFNIIIDI